LVVFPIGVALATIEMQLPAVARLVPIMIGAIVLVAGVLQLTHWKLRHLACCRDVVSDRTLRPNAATAWRLGVRLGLHCGYCCSNLMMILLVLGVMDLRAMAVVTAAITLERLSPVGARIPQLIGTIVIGAGMFLVTHASTA
jgi:predicted metal-binding membrane protein